MNQLANNEQVWMSRRYPKLCHKVLKRDAVIAQKLIKAWDAEKNSDKVLSIFLKEQANLSDERYWELLRTVWVLSGGIKNLDVFKQLMTSKRKERYYFNTPEDAKKLREMPPLFAVYRAGQEGDGGISWTTSEEYAEWYKNTYNKKEILTRLVSQQKVFAYIQRNMEFEIIIL